MIYIDNEESILDLDFRKRVIKFMESEAELCRKRESLKAYEIYKDNVRKYVVEALSKEFTPKTVSLMENRATNINFLKKVVNKIGRAYNSGIKRTGKNEVQTEQLAKAEKALKFNMIMRKADRTVVRSKNAYVHIVPKLNYRETDAQAELGGEKKKKYDITATVFAPHGYTVLADANNPEVGRAVILSDFCDSKELVQSYRGPDGRKEGGYPDTSDQKDDGTNTPDKERENQRHIYWGDKYHLTFNGKGEIVSEESPADYKNPIGRLPGRFLSEDKDGEFWAEGGKDLIDGSTLLNVELTDLICIKNWQGWGQAVMKGKDLDKNVEFGPTKLIKMKFEDGDPEPSFDYHSSNPPLDQHMSTIEMHVALFLSTNNLSPTNVAGKLDATTFPSGVAKVIEDAQSTEPLEERQAYYAEQEPEEWEVYRDWQNLYFDQDALTETFKEIGKIDELEMKIEFHETKQVITEGEKLDNLQKRKNIGINARWELIQKDNPSLSEEEAKKKAAELDKEDQANFERQQEQSAAGSPKPNSNKTDLGSTTKGNPASDAKEEKEAA